MIKKLVTLCTFLLLLLSSCKKDSGTGRDSYLQSRADAAKVIAANISARSALLSIEQGISSGDIVVRLMMKKATESNWQEVLYTSASNIPITDLDPKTTYEARLELTLTKENIRKYSATTQFTTKAFSINFGKYFEKSYGLYDNNSSFSIESAVHTIYGSGFSNESAINIRLQSRDNSSDVLNIKADIVNDSTLTFRIPANFIANSPYVVRKQYSCVIGDQVLISYLSYINSRFDDTGTLSIVNRDIDINQFTFIDDAGSCDMFLLKGHFGTNEQMTVCPPFMLGVSVIMSERKLLIRSGGTLVKEFPILAAGSASCDVSGLAGVDPAAVSATLKAYHEVNQVNVLTTIPPGSYTAQVKQVTQDGTILLSNEFVFSF